VDTLICIISIFAAGILIYKLDDKVRRKRLNTFFEPRQESVSQISEEERRAIELEMIKRSNRERENQIIMQRDARRVRRGPRGGRYTVARTRNGRPYRRYF